jgi:hypothetical protein
MSKELVKMLAHIAKIKEEFEPRNDEDCFYFPRPNFHYHLTKVVLDLCGRIQDLEERLDANAGKAD